ncbi:MAG TPA: YcxB family protein [Xanthobacteraceae bacterium]|nr:YcxB family protein [Xanthobacteraceae bacterium]
MLVAAYAAFTAGYFSYWGMLRRYYRKFHRSSMRRGPWNYSFGPDGIVYKSETVEVRYGWRGVEAVEDLGRIVLFSCDERAIYIPAHMFADTAARQPSSPPQPRGSRPPPQAPSEIHSFRAARA